MRNSGAMPEHPYPAEQRSFRDRLVARLFRTRAGGIRVRNLAFGPPASAEQIARVERDHLGFAMPPAMRSWFAAHDGASLFYHRVDDLAAEIDDDGVPLVVEDDAPLRWSDAMHDGGALWREIEAVDFGRGEYGFFFVGLFCVPSLREMFETDWRAIFGWPAGMVLLDAYHPFHASALVHDAATRALHVQPTADHGADRDAAPLALADYFNNLVEHAGADRVIDGRLRAVRSHG